MEVHCRWKYQHGTSLCFNVNCDGVSPLILFDTIFYTDETRLSTQLLEKINGSQFCQSQFCL